MPVGSRLSVLSPQKASLALRGARSTWPSKKRRALESLNPSFMTYSVTFGK